jgi:hypothetical protein
MVPASLALLANLSRATLFGGVDDSGGCNARGSGLDPGRRPAPCNTRDGDRPARHLTLLREAVDLGDIIESPKNWLDKSQQEAQKGRLRRALLVGNPDTLTTRRCCCEEEGSAEPGRWAANRRPAG